MRIAVPYEKEEIFPHFGKAERFKIYDVEKGEILFATVVNTNGSGGGALPDILKKLSVNVLICGGIGSGACRALEGAGVGLYENVSGRTDDAVKAYLNGTLTCGLKAPCRHPDKRPDQGGKDGKNDIEQAACAGN